MRRFELDMCERILAQARSLDALMSEQPCPASGHMNIAGWHHVFDSDGRIIEQVHEGDTIDVHLRAHLAFHARHGRFALTQIALLADARALYVEHVQARYYKALSGVFGGQVIGPIFGLASVVDLEGYLLDQGLGSSTQLMLTPASSDDIHAALATEPWGALSRLADAPYRPAEPA